jgi:hypothetical protein
MKPVATNPEMEVVPSSRSNGAQREPDPAEVPGLAKARLLWRHRRVLARAAVWGLLAATVIAFLIPKQYESTTRLMPPDDQSGAGMALMATLSGKLSGGLGSLAGDVLGMKSSGDLFIGILGSRTVKDDPSPSSTCAKRIGKAAGKLRGGFSVRRPALVMTARAASSPLWSPTGIHSAPPLWRASMWPN